MTKIMPPATALSLENSATFDLNGGHLTITGSSHGAIIDGSLTGDGSITNTGTLRLIGDAGFNLTDPTGASQPRMFYRVALHP